MSDKPETLAAILAEMRASARDSFASKLVAEYEETGRLDEAPAAQALKDDDVYLVQLADRIEAAAERERVKARHDATALREALVEILDRTNREKARNYDAALNGGILEIHDIANTALQPN